MVFTAPSVAFVPAPLFRAPTSFATRQAFIPTLNNSRLSPTRTTFLPSLPRPAAAAIPAHSPRPFTSPTALAEPVSDLSIASLLPNPVGTDRGKEVITLRNRGTTQASLQGWSLTDYLGQTETLSGTVPPGDTLSITLTGDGAQLKNTGDNVSLINPAGVAVYNVKYSGPVVPGKTVDFDLSIAAMLPNAVGTDRGNETVTLRNRGWAEASLQGWKLKDHLGNVEELNGVVPPGGELLITLSGDGVLLKNTGEEISLINPNRIVVNKVNYKGAMAPGRILNFD